MTARAWVALAALGCAGPVAAQAPAGRAPTPPAAQAPADTTPLPPQEIGTVRIGQTVHGLLEAGDWTMGDGTYADVWYFQAEAGQRVVIELSSRAFDSYLQLLDPWGGRLAENDDGLGRDRGARINYMVREAGRFQVVVNNYDEDPRTGRYQLTLR